MKFKIGDKVRAKKGRECPACVGRVMTISKTNNGTPYPIICKFDNTDKEELFEEDALEFATIKHDFQWAVAQMKQGKKVRATCWMPKLYCYSITDLNHITIYDKNLGGELGAELSIRDIESDWELYSELLNEYEGLKVGDDVEIINRGKLYARYGKMAEIMKLDKWKDGCFEDEGQTLIGKIVCFSNHETQPSYMLCAVRINNRDYIIDVEGVKKIEKDFCLSNKMKTFIGNLNIENFYREDVKEFIKQLKEFIVHRKDNLDFNEYNPRMNWKTAGQTELSNVLFTIDKLAGDKLIY